MSKPRRSLHIRLPPYRAPRLAWRRAIQKAAAQQQRERRVVYKSGDRLALEVTLYFDHKAVGWHDVDNRLKDVMDALQGRVGGPKARRPLSPIIRNDNQIYSVTVKKVASPPQSHSRGHVWVRQA